jgi:hypothetical protein
MWRMLIVLAAGGLLGGAGCRHCCGDRPRLFDREDRREPDCDRDRCPPTGRGASAPRLGAPLAGQPAGLSGGSAYPVLPVYTAPVVPRTEPGVLPAPSTIPPTDVPLAPTSPAVPGASLLPAPSAFPVVR